MICWQKFTLNLSYSTKLKLVTSINIFHSLFMLFICKEQNWMKKGNLHGYTWSVIAKLHFQILKKGQKGRKRLFVCLFFVFVFQKYLSTLKTAKVLENRQLFVHNLKPCGHFWPRIVRVKVHLTFGVIFWPRKPDVWCMVDYYVVKNDHAVLRVQKLSQKRQFIHLLVMSKNV